MVGEFPELQGTMGRYYALNDGEDGEVAVAIEDHYRPRFAGDELPRNPAGALVAVADKLETLVGLFAIDQLPTGDKDPFALRRHALGVLRILTERLPTLSLDRAVDAAFAAPAWPAAASGATIGSNGSAPSIRAPLLAFFADRLAASLADRGYSAAEIGAVLADDKFWQLGEVEPRLLALRQFAALPEARGAGGGEQARRQHPEEGEPSPIGGTVDPALLREPAEVALDAALAHGDAAGRGGARDRRLRRLAPRPGRPAHAGRRVLRLGDGQCRRCGACAPTGWRCSAGCTRR